MEDKWKSNEFAKKYRDKLTNSKSKALNKLKHSEVKTGAGKINILRLGNEK